MVGFWRVTTRGTGSVHLSRLEQKTTACWCGLPSRLQKTATFVDAKIWRVRDRGLEHAVEKEKHLLALHSLKDFILRSSEDDSSKCRPLSSIVENRRLLSLPFRPISFIRLYRSAFIEEMPPKQQPQPPLQPSFDPVIRPTEELLWLHGQELPLYESCRDETAQRLLRLLMLTRRRAIPLHVLDRLRWDLGLPLDYSRSLLPHYPHYFQLNPQPPFPRLDLVLWDHRLAVSTFQHTRKGSSSFPQQIPEGLQMDKKIVKWMDEWQTLPYISPYDDDGPHLDPKSALAEKWGVGLLHELLHLLIPKKTARDDLILLANLAGLTLGACKKLLQNYPGIFYVSDKNDTYTVLLREAYKRGALVEMHPLMEMRYRYVHLMHRPMVKKSGGRGKDPRNPKVLDGAPSDFGCDEDDYDYEEEEYDDEEEEWQPSESAKTEEYDDMPQPKEVSYASEMPQTGPTRGVHKKRDEDMGLEQAPVCPSNPAERSLNTRKVCKRPNKKSQEITRDARPISKMVASNRNDKRGDHGMRMGTVPIQFSLVETSPKTRKAYKRPSKKQQEVGSISKTPTKN